MSGAEVTSFMLGVLLLCDGRLQVGHNTKRILEMIIIKEG